MAETMADTIIIASPPASTTTRSRSTTGCWTCRVRRKKCDEKPDECSTCLSLRLVCAGYGPKPIWMDGGALEKQKAEEIKADVNKQRRRGRRRRQFSRGSISGDNALSLQTDIDASRNGTWDGGGESQNLLTSPAHDNSSETRHDSHSAAVDGDAGPSGVTASPTHDFFATSSHAPGLPSEVCSLSDFERVLATISDFDPPGPTSTWEQSLATSQTFLDTPHPDESYMFDFGPAPLPIASPLPGLQELLEPASFAELGPPTVPRTDFPSLYHVDHIIPNILPFLTHTARRILRDRALLPNPGSAAMVHASTLALSCSYRKLGLERISGYPNSALDAAIRENTSESLRLVRAALQHTHANDQDLPDIALSLLQVLLLHVEQGLSDHDNIASLLQSIVARCNSRPTADDVLARVVSAVAVAHDVLWSASARRRPLLTGDSASIAKLNAFESDIQQAIGSDGWILQHIAEVTLLRIWKRECQASQALNVAELARRATKLEQQIDGHAQEPICQAQATAIDKPCSSITRVYVAATKIYLHVVLSGASPEVSDIHNAVGAAVDAIKALSDATLVRRLAWPICVAASLAEARHETFFDHLEQGARGDRDYCTNVLRALAVAQETKRLRRNSASRVATFDWMDAMESLGHEWVLL